MQLTNKKAGGLNIIDGPHINDTSSYIIKAFKWEDLNNWSQQYILCVHYCQNPRWNTKEYLKFAKLLVG